MEKDKINTINKVLISQECTNPNCRESYPIDQMIFSCKKCTERLEYVLNGKYDGKANKEYKNQWKNFDLIPLESAKNIVTLNEGGSEIIELEEISEFIGSAKLLLMLDMDQNPTGTFKDREASIILSRCNEIGLNNLVYYSTGNTGRAYTHYAAKLGLTTYFFMPEQCHYKNTDFISKNPNNFIIYVKNNYSEIAPYAKKFASVNNLNLIAPMHDRTESYATVAYEQFEKIPNCSYFIQTIASGMGPIGFLKGYDNLIKFGLTTQNRVPRIVCVQSSEMNVMSTAFNNGRTNITIDDLPKTFPSDLFEPTLNSTNPVNNYPDLYKCLKKSNGIITDVTPDYVNSKGSLILEALKRRKIHIRNDIEKSLLIEFAGLIQLADKKTFTKKDTVVMLACGRGKDTSRKLLNPDITIDPKTDDPLELKQKLDSILANK
jgi:threonine synthase